MNHTVTEEMLEDMVGLVGEIQLFIVYTIQLAMANYSHALDPFQLKGSYPLIVILQQVLE